MRSSSSSTRTTAAARAASSRKTRRRCCYSAGRTWSARWASKAALRGCRRRNPTSISQAGPWGAARARKKLRLVRSARGYELLFLEFRGCVARRQIAQAAVQRFTGDSVALEFGRRIARRQIAQAAVQRFTGDSVALEFGRRVARRQIAQAAV